MNTSIDNLGNLGNLVAYLGIILAAAVAYGKAFGPYQTEITQAVIESADVPKRHKRLVNYGVGILVAMAFTGVAAYALGSWAVFLPGVFAGFLASVEAGRTHDETATS